MTRLKSLPRRIIEFGVNTALVAAALLALSRGSPAATGETAAASSKPAKSPVPEIITYGVGYALALVLTITAFALVHWHWASPSTALGIVFALGLVQIIVHFRCFLHVTFQGPARDDLQLILFSTLIVCLMVGGTMVILFNLRMRMM